MPPRRACDVCYKRKIQCSIPNPGSPCDWCRHQNLACTFLREPERKRTEQPTLHAVNDLLRRVEYLEAELVRKDEQAQDRSLSQRPSFSTGATARISEVAEVSQYCPSPGSGSAQTLVPNPSEPPDALLQAQSPIIHSDSGAFRPLGRHLGQIWYFKGMPILSPRGWEWISSKTGQDTHLDTLFSNPNPLPSMLDSRDERPELPDEPTTRRVLDALNQSSSSFVFSIFDWATFQNTMGKAYMTSDRPHISQPQISAKTCIWAFHALASLSKSVRSLSISVEGEECAEKVQSLLGYVLGESSLENLQAILMLQLYRMATGQWQCSELLLSVACRMVCDLGGHTQQHSGQTPQGEASAERQRHRIRMAFLVVSCADVSLRSGQPPLLAGNYCDLTLPGIYTGFSRGASAKAFESEDLTCYVSRNPSISMIKGRIFHLLYSPRASGSSDSQLVLNIRHLDDELEQWRLSIPAEMRPRLSVSPSRPLMPPGTGKSHVNGHVNLQLEHLYMLTAIHAAVRRAGAEIGEGENLPEDLHSVIHSSVDITLEAGRSKLLFLKASMDILQEDAFHYLVFYAPIAAMSLFVNVLVHPLHASSDEDLKALMAALSNIQSIPLRGLTKGETERLQELHNFIMELVRLGNCAIWKAKKDRRI